MNSFTFRKNVWHWNPRQGFFFLPVEYPKRKREVIIREGHRLYPILRAASGYL